MRAAVVMLLGSLLAHPFALAQNAPRQTALPELHLTQPEAGIIPLATVQRDANTGQIRRIRGNIPMAHPKTAREAAVRFLKANRKMLNLSEPLAELSVVRDIESLTRHHVTYQQVYNGLPVFDGQLSVHTDKAFVIQLVNDDLVPIIQKRDLQRPKDPSQAIDAAVLAVNAPSGPTQKPIAEAGIVVEKGIPVVVWRVLFDTRSPGGAWKVLVEAKTNQVLSTENIAQYFHTQKESKP